MCAIEEVKNVAQEAEDPSGLLTIGNRCLVKASRVKKNTYLKPGLLVKAKRGGKLVVENETNGVMKIQVRHEKPVGSSSLKKIHNFDIKIGDGGLVEFNFQPKETRSIPCQSHQIEVDMRVFSLMKRKKNLRC